MNHAEIDAEVPVNAMKFISLRTATYASAGVLVLALLGLAAGPETGATPVIMWVLVLVSAATLMGAVFFTRGVPGQLESQYEDNLQAVTHRYEQLAARDWLTGLLSETEFMTAAKMELSRSGRHGHQASIALIEPDKQSMIEIQKVEEGREAAARYIADALTVVLRESDVLACRPDGSGIIVLLPETDATGAAVAADRMQSRFERTNLVLPDGSGAAIPIDVAGATYPRDGRDAQELMNHVTTLVKE